MHGGVHKILSRPMAKKCLCPRPDGRQNSWTDNGLVRNRDMYNDVNEYFFSFITKKKKIYIEPDEHY